VNARSEIFTTPSLEGVRLNALHWGDESRPKLVLLHGGGANAHWWDHLAPSLSERFHVVALDFRGHGDSDHPEELAVGAFDGDLRALLEHIGTEEVFLAGHSMGGNVALRHAATEASTRGLVAIDVSRGAKRQSRRAARLALVLRRTYRSREEAIARYRFLPSTTQASEALRLAIAGNSVRREPDGRFGYKFDPRWFGIPPAPKPELARLDCPILLIRGDQSEMLTRNGARELLAEIPDGRLVEIEGAGHHAHLDRPEQVLSAMESFLVRRL
jgi:pimeloyl-ACP methyl ester carboxylesterase